MTDQEKEPHLAATLSEVKRLEEPEKGMTVDREDEYLHVEEVNITFLDPEQADQADHAEEDQKQRQQQHVGSKSESSDEDEDEEADEHRGLRLLVEAGQSCLQQMKTETDANEDDQSDPDSEHDNGIGNSYELRDRRRYTAPVHATSPATCSVFTHRLLQNEIETNRKKRIKRRRVEPIVSTEIVIKPEAKIEADVSFCHSAPAPPAISKAYVEQSLKNNSTFSAHMRSPYAFVPIPIMYFGSHLKIGPMQYRVLVSAQTVDRTVYIHYMDPANFSSPNKTKATADKAVANPKHNPKEDEAALMRAMMFAQNVHFSEEAEKEEEEEEIEQIEEVEQERNRDRYTEEDKNGKKQDEAGANADTDIEHENGNENGYGSRNESDLSESNFISPAATVVLTNKLRLKRSQPSRTNVERSSQAFALAPRVPISHKKEKDESVIVSRKKRVRSSNRNCDGHKNEDDSDLSDSRFTAPTRPNRSPKTTGTITTNMANRTHTSIHPKGKKIPSSRADEGIESKRKRTMFENTEDGQTVHTNKSPQKKTMSKDKGKHKDTDTEADWERAKFDKNVVITATPDSSASESESASASGSDSARRTHLMASRSNPYPVLRNPPEEVHASREKMLLLLQKELSFHHPISIKEANSVGPCTIGMKIDPTKGRLAFSQYTKKKDRLQILRNCELNLIKNAPSLAEYTDEATLRQRLLKTDTPLALFYVQTAQEKIEARDAMRVKRENEIREGKELYRMKKEDVNAIVFMPQPCACVNITNTASKCHRVEHEQGVPCGAVVSIASLKAGYRTCMECNTPPASRPLPRISCICDGGSSCYRVIDPHLPGARCIGSVLPSRAKRGVKRCAACQYKKHKASQSCTCDGGASCRNDEHKRMHKTNTTATRTENNGNVVVITKTSSCCRGTVPKCNYIYGVNVCSFCYSDCWKYGLDAEDDSDMDLYDHTDEDRVKYKSKQVIEFLVAAVEGAEKEGEKGGASLPTNTAVAKVVLASSSSSSSSAPSLTLRPSDV